MKQSPHSTQQVEQLRATVNQLQSLLRRMQEERERTARQRRKRMLLIAVPISLTLHVMLMGYLAMVDRGTEAGGDPRPVPIEFAMVNEEELSTLDADLSDLLDIEPVDLSAEVEETPMVQLDVALSGADMASADVTAMESLGGTGDGLTGGESGLSAGGGTSYFGISGQGTRFAYIVDRSGSMGSSNKMSIASTELARSIQALPDYAHYYVLYFSSGVLAPPMQRGWMPARRASLRSMVRWIESVDPSGGTMPFTAFKEVFDLEVLPDVIFFMTDGLIAASALTADQVASMNSGSKRVVIHTIAFGDQGSEDLLRRIAQDSGGKYRYVPVGDEAP